MLLQPGRHLWIFQMLEVADLTADISRHLHGLKIRLSGIPCEVPTYQKMKFPQIIMILLFVIYWH